MGAIAVLVAGVLWGTTGFSSHFAPAGSNPFAIGAGSMGFGGVIMAILALSKQGRQVSWGPSRKAMLWGAACLWVYPLCFYGAMHYSGIAVGTAINIGSSPIMATLIERVLGRAVINKNRLTAAALAIVGLAMLSIGGHANSAHPGSGPNPAVGIVLGLLAGLTYAGISAAAHEMIRLGVPSNVAMGRIFGIGAIFLVPLCVALPGPLLDEPRGWGVLAYLAFVPMATSYLLFGYGLRSVSASTAVTLTLVEPVVAAILAVFVVGEPMALIGWLGMALVLGGVMVMGREGEGPHADVEHAPVP